MKKKLIIIFKVALFIYCLFSVVPGFAQDSNLLAKLQEQLRNRIESAGMPPVLMVGEEKIFSSIMLQKFYEKRVYVPAWFDRKKPAKNINELIKCIKNAAKEGLRPTDYHLSIISRILEDIKIRQKSQNPIFYHQLIDLELLLTDAYLILGAHYLAGRINPQTIDSEWFANRRDADLAEVMQYAVQNYKIEDSLQKLLPPQAEYQRLKRALASYQQISRIGGWQSIPDGPELQKGDQSDRIVILRKRLRVSNDLRTDKSLQSPIFTDDVEAALQRFQKRHGLDVNGVLDQQTLCALNKSVDERIEQIEINMERWRWLPQDLGQRYIIVNIANYELDVFEDKKEVLTMSTIVGKSYRRTPVFSGLMTYLVLSPYWHVPPGIAKEDILPAVKKNVSYLSSKNIKIFQGWGEETKEIDPDTVDWSKVTADNFVYRFRQDPGPDNALGDVKFMFPNQFNIYLHDTPSKELFQKAERGFSSGCIRIQKPVELAEYVLKGDGNWTKDKIIAAIDKRVEQTVRLPEAIPVHILYWTAWVSADGQIHFRNDLYGRDKLLLKALKEAPPGD